MNSFTEKQKFTQWWLWLILAGAVVIPIGIVIVTNKYNISQTVLAAIISGAALPASVMVLFRSFRLDTKYDELGVSYRFFPLQVKMKNIPWADVSKAYVRQYKPLVEYGGWGIRHSLGNKGKAYNISGNMGLQLELKDGKGILFGTQQPDQIKATLVELVRERKLDKAVIN